MTQFVELEFFCATNLKGPRPRRGTVLEVTILARSEALQSAGGAN